MTAHTLSTNQSLPEVKHEEKKKRKRNWPSTTATNHSPAFLRPPKTLYCRGLVGPEGERGSGTHVTGEEGAKIHGSGDY